MPSGEKTCNRLVVVSRSVILTAPSKERLLGNRRCGKGIPDTAQSSFAQEGFKQILEVEKDNNETSRIQEPITRKQEKIGCDSESKRSCVSFGILDSPLGTADKRSKVCAKQ